MDVGGESAMDYMEFEEVGMIQGGEEIEKQFVDSDFFNSNFFQKKKKINTNTYIKNSNWYHQIKTNKKFYRQ